MPDPRDPARVYQQGREDRESRHGVSKDWSVRRFRTREAGTADRPAPPDSFDRRRLPDRCPPSSEGRGAVKSRRGRSGLVVPPAFPVKPPAGLATDGCTREIRYWRSRRARAKSSTRSTISSRSPCSNARLRVSAHHAIRKLPYRGLLREGQDPEMAHMAGVEHANDCRSGRGGSPRRRFGRGLQRLQLRFQAASTRKSACVVRATERRPRRSRGTRPGEVDMGGQSVSPTSANGSSCHAIPAVAEEAPGPMARAVQLGGGIP